jgi:hypothetical protein
MCFEAGNLISWRIDKCESTYSDHNYNVHGGGWGLLV